MKKLSFLAKLKKEKKLKLVEPSEEIAKSYLIKSEKCIQVAKLAYEAGIYENAVSEAYYSIYNTVMTLFFKCGIKCENHSGSVLLIKELFQFQKLYSIFSEFKKDRIDNQYYMPVIDTEPIDKEKCNERIKTAQRFSIELRSYANKITTQYIKNIREQFKKI
ncbi:MAG: HEPN domain-containing protein [Nanoarchaeota archaeon]|nr:HEPN domain-containing protein [Nanoarchaeota archaeon]MBU1854883.1 HEPN domain-containing protein [Nanoarchaeota archaeon]